MNYEKLANNKVFLAALIKKGVDKNKINEILAYLDAQSWSIDDIQAAVDDPSVIDLTDESPDIIVFKDILSRNQNGARQTPPAQPIVVQATLNAPVDYASMNVKQLLKEALKTGFTDENLILLIQEKIGRAIYVAVNKDKSINPESTELVLQMILRGGEAKNVMLPNGVSLKKITVEEIKTYTLPNGQEVPAKLDLVAFVYYACEQENGYTKTFLRLLLNNPQESDYWADWENLEEEDQDFYKEKVRAASKKKHRPSLDELLAEDDPDNFHPRPQVEISSKPFPTDQEIRSAMTVFFDFNEIKSICFELGIDDELISGSEKSEKARNLIGYIKRGAAKGVTLKDLVILMRKLRRNMNI